MVSFPRLIEWRTWRWRAVVSALQATTRSFTLRDLLDSLEMYRNRTNSSHLSRLIALLKEDLATAARYPERRGAPDTRRTLGGWRQRYNHLDRYLTLEIAGAPDGRQAILVPDDCNTQALSAAEYEGWPLPLTRKGV
ncbi:hypothetical protein LK996_06080 [Lysobacter sp. A6]|uniref:Uncharacterized protein n=1 Tax=Noviluteimonas lactosilytica TaxID=2888523 RepID=A0ABS8JGB3_9GAMM|nr:hypothetical protein [Lysobacter lactosilyticus]MCC8362641.1 hypothetical protein [Lysobacter lactosilyticus]